MSDEVLIALITLIPTLTTILTSYLHKRRENSIRKIRDEENRRDQAKNSINLLILHDKVNWGLSRHLPTNIDNVLEEFDKYEKNFGNSYMHKLVDEYKEWYGSVEEEIKQSKKRKTSKTSKTKTKGAKNESK